MRFKNIKGLEEVKSKLINSVKRDKLAHAILLSGEDGALNLPLALAFATYLNCLNRMDNDACGECASCEKNAKYIHPDLNFVFPVTPKAGVKPADVISRTFLVPWRQFLTEKPYGNEGIWAHYLESENKQFNISKGESRQIISSLSLKAFEGEYKIMLIWLPEYMHPSAANGILKILEEPTDKTVFLLVTNDREALLSTILSRVLTIHVRKPTIKELTTELIEDFAIEKGVAEIAAKMSEGNLSHAIALIEKGNDENEVDLSDWLLHCLGFNTAALVDFADKFAGMNKLSQRGFLKYGVALLREVLIENYGSKEVKRTSQSEKKIVEKLAGILTVQGIEKMMTLLEKSLYYMERNANVRIAFMELSIEFAKVLNKK